MITKILIVILSLQLTIATDIECILCQKFFKSLQQEILYETSLLEIEKIATRVCDILVTKYPSHFSQPIDIDVCNGLVDEFTIEVIYILAKSKLNPSSICIYLEKCEKSPLHWNVLINGSKPLPNPPPTHFSDTYTILHITDIHLDLDYLINSTIDCGEPVCCRKGNGFSRNGAGRWGEYDNCDTNIDMYENMFQWISSKFNIDFIFYTGDSIGHYVWETTKNNTITVFDITYSIAKRWLPYSRWLGAVGNHDSSPVNMFPPPEINSGPNNNSWVYHSLSRIWGKELDINAKTLLQQYGYYKQRLDNNLVLISLNMNFGDPENWWLLVYSIDPANMLQWLSNTLQEAENNNDKVYIIGHQPSNREIYNFSETFDSIVYRYEHTIIAQFYGHSHKDEFYLFSKDKHCFSTGYIAGSITPYSFLNPGFRIYTVDKDSNYIIDSDTYIYNLTLANILGYPTWYLEYSARDTYNFKGTFLLNENWCRLSNELYTNDNYWNSYHTFLYKSSDYIPYCNETCRNNTIQNI